MPERWFCRFSCGTRMSWCPKPAIFSSPATAVAHAMHLLSSGLIQSTHRGPDAIESYKEVKMINYSKRPWQFVWPWAASKASWLGWIFLSSWQNRQFCLHFFFCIEPSDTFCYIVTKYSPLQQSMSTAARWTQFLFIGENFTFSLLHPK